MVLTETLRDEIDEWLPELIETRRDFHRHPELGLEEFRTAGIVADRLRAIGFEDVRTGIAVTGVKAVLRGGRPGRTLLLRADMDALPIEEQNDVEYKSTIAGQMHACGHDGHTAMLLSAARMLYPRRDEIPGTIVFCFQPAEEGRGGAKRMIEEGLLEDPHVDAAISIHLLSFEPTGIAVAVDGPTLAGSDRFSVTIQGSGGHGAMPHKTVDALLIAAEVVTTLQTLVAREVDPQKSAVVSVGTLHAGTTAANIIADSATLSGTVRWYDDEVGDMLARRIPELIQGIATTMRGSADVQYRRGIGATVNDPAVAAIVREAAAEVVGPENTWSGPRLSASDDICEVFKLVPGTHFFVGCRDESTGKIYEHHHPRFDIDERALPLGVEIFTRAALLWLERNQT